jgi:hypothetical protein
MSSLNGALPPPLDAEPEAEPGDAWP